MEVKWYNFAAQIYKELNKVNSSLIFQFLQNNGFDNIINKVSNFDFSIVDENWIKGIIKEINEKKFENAILFLKAIDIGVNEDVIETVKYNNGLLNNNCDELLVYVSYGHVDHYNHAHENLNTFFENIYFIGLSHFSGICSNNTIKNVYYDNSSKTKLDSIKLVFLPYPYNEDLKFNEDGYIRGEKLINFLYDKKLKDKSDSLFLNRFTNYCEKENFSLNNVLFFSPEMMGSSKIDSFIYDKLKANRDIIGYFCPSYHERLDDNKIKNSAKLYTFQNRAVVPLELVKHNRASSEGLIENITGDFGINVFILHIKGFGKIMFLICKDFISDEYNKLIESIMPEIIVVQAYSTKFSPFITMARSICCNNSYVFIGNSCNAAKQEKAMPKLMIIAKKNTGKEDEETLVEFIDVCDAKSFSECCNKETCYHAFSCFKRANTQPKHFKTGNKYVKHPTTFIEIIKEEENE